jgi:AraC-like DNA-binding protein
MIRSNQTATTAVTLEPIQPHRPEISIIGDEATWRSLPLGGSGADSPSRILVTRWQAIDMKPLELSSETPEGWHIVKVILRTANIRLSINSKTVHDGTAMPGMFHVTAPGTKADCLFRGPYDNLHLHIPNRLIAEYARDIAADPTAPRLSTAALTKDTIIERLGRALLAADQIGGALGYRYADCIGMAIVMRLLTSLDCGVPSSDRPKIAELARWRLKRAIDFVEANLAEPVSTADVASAIGLTRMHFAAQFRAATGLRPHEYMLRRRIERAQEMLIRTSMPVVDIALSVGFQSQSHFTSIFRRLVGQPPHAWRRSREPRTNEARERSTLPQF